MSREAWERVGIYMGFFIKFRISFIGEPIIMLNIDPTLLKQNFKIATIPKVYFSEIFHCFLG